MNNSFVVTIGREYGSQGMAIGKKLSEMLGVPMYYKELVNLAAKEMDESEEELLAVDETFSMTVPNIFLNKSMYPVTLQDRLFDVEKDIIRRLARTESCILIGHCASFVLRDFSNVLNVFIYAPNGVRFQHLLNERNLSKEATIRLMEDADRNRHNYYEHYTKKKRGSRELRQVMLDSSIFGVEGTAQVLKRMIEVRFGI